MTDERIKLALTDRQAVACTVYGEARREPIIGQIAIAYVIRTRTLNPRRFGQGWKGVCHRRAQFSCWYPWGGESNYRAVMDVAKLLIKGTIPVKGSALAIALQVADDVMLQRVPDPTGGADHYYAPGAMVPKGRVPAWAVNQTPTARLDAHIFYRLG